MQYADPAPPREAESRASRAISRKTPPGHLRRTDINRARAKWYVAGRRSKEARCERGLAHEQTATPIFSGIIARPRPSTQTAGISMESLAAVAKNSSLFEQCRHPKVERTIGVYSVYSMTCGKLSIKTKRKPLYSAPRRRRIYHVAQLRAPRNSLSAQRHHSPRH